MFEHPMPVSIKSQSYLPQSRRLADRKPPFQIQQRDLRILQAIFENRFLTLSLLAQLFPPDLARTPKHLPTENPVHPNTNLARRLSKLFHHRCLDRVRTIRGGELVYALAQNGANILRSGQVPLFVRETDWAEKNREISQPYIDHALMVARFRVALTAACLETPATTIEDFQRETRDLKAEWKHQGARLYVAPDGFLILRDAERPEGKQRSAFFLEADRSTMTLDRLLQKIERYCLMFADRVHQEHFKIPNFRVLLVAKSAARASNLLKLALNEKIPEEYRGFFLVTTEESFRAHPRNVLAAIWRSADNPQELRSIIPSPLARV